MAQIKDFAAFVKRTRDASGPAVMAADFNFTYPAADSTLFEKLTGATSAEKTCLAGSCTGDAPGPILKESDDHQFTLAGKRGGLKAIHVAQTFKEPHKGKPLSDHWALESVYSFVGARAP
jgi:hypothetical protein